MQPDQPFTEPWHATVFALTVHLHEQGHFTWPEWTAAFSERRQSPTAAQDGSDYFEDWAANLEEILITANVTDPDTVAALSQAWFDAAHATPHGQPIELPADRPRA